MTSDLINKLYNQIIEKLKEDLRPQVKLSSEDIQEISNQWESLLNQKKNREKLSLNLKKILCILDNTQTTDKVFEVLILKTFKVIDDEQLLVYTLSASLKHIIERRFKNGDRVEMSFINALRELLHNDSPEVKEWTLRVIEQIGTQSIILKDDILMIKPSILARFNKHKLALKQIIELLEKRWSI